MRHPRPLPPSLMLPAIPGTLPWPLPMPPGKLAPARPRAPGKMPRSRLGRPGGLHRVPQSLAMTMPKTVPHLPTTRPFPRLGMPGSPQRTRPAPPGSRRRTPSPALGAVAVWTGLMRWQMPGSAGRLPRRKVGRPGTKPSGAPTTSGLWAAGGANLRGWPASTARQLPRGGNLGCDPGMPDAKGNRPRNVHGMPPSREPGSKSSCSMFYCNFCFAIAGGAPDLLILASELSGPVTAVPTTLWPVHLVPPGTRP
jgi:hypothetical protein